MKMSRLSLAPAASIAESALALTACAVENTSADFDSTKSSDEANVAADKMSEVYTLSPLGYDTLNVDTSLPSMIVKAAEFGINPTNNSGEHDDEKQASKCDAVVAARQKGNLSWSAVAGYVNSSSAASNAAQAASALEW